MDRVLTVLLSTAMFVGGFIGFVLDNTVPGKYIVVEQLTYGDLTISLISISRLEYSCFKVIAKFTSMLWIRFYLFNINVKILILGS